MICTSCGKKCFDSQYPEVVFKDNDTCICEACTEPTKYICGLWDGRDPKTGKCTYGAMFDCKNHDCEVKIREHRAFAEHEQLLARVATENEKNGVDIESMARERKDGRYTSIRQMADYLGISPSQYSDYEKGRVAVPKDVYKKILRHFEGRHVDAKDN